MGSFGGLQSSSCCIAALYRIAFFAVKRPAVWKAKRSCLLLFFAEKRSMTGRWGLFHDSGASLIPYYSWLAAAWPAFSVPKRFLDCYPWCWLWHQFYYNLTFSLLSCHFPGDELSVRPMIYGSWVWKGCRPLLCGTHRLHGALAWLTTLTITLSMLKKYEQAPINLLWGKIGSGWQKGKLSFRESVCTTDVLTKDPTNSPL